MPIDPPRRTTVLPTGTTRLVAALLALALAACASGDPVVPGNDPPPRPDRDTLGPDGSSADTGDTRVPTDVDSSTGTNPGTGADVSTGTDDPDVTPSDTTSQPDPDPVAFGQPCTEDADCADALCLHEGHDDIPFCSRPCDENDCPAGFTCETVRVDETDTPVCLPDAAGCTGECSPGDIEQRSRSCGSCSEGTEEASRTCGLDCQWGDWSRWSNCITDAVCVPFQVETETEDCPGCTGAVQERSRECDRSTCHWGEWSTWTDCSTGTACSPGQIDTDTRNCPCGEPDQRQRTCTLDGCGWGPWSDWRGCTGSICSPGAIQTDEESCGGACGSGVRSRTRTCRSDGCSWNDWSRWSDCSGTDICSPGEVDTDTRSCSCAGSGTEQRSRTCTDSCDWGPYGNWSGCPDEVCSPGDTAPCANNDPCGHRVCTSACAWGDCEPAPGNECLRIRPGTQGPLGNNWRCCGTSQWQFCLSSCEWSSNCAVCENCSC